MKFTVCTATYNRAHTLSRVFESLVSQTFKNFEWLIIDDGSSDNTVELVNEWIATSSLDITYVFQENQGKHIAVNHGARLAKGELFLIADSDDAVLPNALHDFLEAWLNIPKEERELFTGITGLCISQEGKLIGDAFPSDVFDTTSADLFYRYNIHGEKWGFHRTEVIRHYPFPEISGYPFVSEGLVWHAISRSYKTRFINKPVRIYSQDSADRLTIRSCRARAKETVFYAMYLNADINYLYIAPLRIMKLAIQGSRLAFHNQDRVHTQVARLDNYTSKFLWLIALPLGRVLYWYDNFSKK